MRRFLALVLTVIISVGTISTVANAAKFTDVSASNETLTKAVDLLSSVGITTGTTETTYGTSQKVTRQQMATFIYRLMKAGKTVEGKQGDNTTTFTDLDDPFYYFMISWANGTGIIKGRSDTQFDPNGGIILQDAYVMITRALGYEKGKTLAYPYDYINVAEKLGLGDGLPVNVGYNTTLSRGNVAILLYNAFYADMATGTTAYQIEYEEVELPGGRIEWVEKGSTPYTVYDTVAEKIFGIKKTVQRVVATPNYCLDTYEKTIIDDEDGEKVLLECFDDEYAETDIDLFDAAIDMKSLGLTGNADDYFLIDLSVYYKEEEGKAPEIVSATALGTRTKNIAGSKVKFETSTKEYMYNKNEARFRAFTGKVTIDGKEAYLFNAPWSYSKPEDITRKDDENITLLWLDATERDPEDDEYVPDFNFKSDRDVMGRGAGYYSTQKEVTLYTKDGSSFDVKEVYDLEDKDYRAGGLYTTNGLYMGMIIDVHSSTNFEVDIWDSNGDGKVDYMWTKPYAAGQLDLNEAESFMGAHKNEDLTNIDNWGPIYDAKEVPTIYAYGANTADGIKPSDDSVVVAYLNAPANYIRIVSSIDLTYNTQTFNGRKGSDKNNITLDGSNTNIWGGSTKLIGIPGKDGTRQLKCENTPSQIDQELGPYVDVYFTDDQLGNEYNIARVNGLIFHMKSAGGTLATTSDYALIFPNTRGAYAYTDTIGIVTDGKLELSGNMLEVMVGGKLVSVTVKPQTSSITASKITAVDANGETYSLMPVTPKEANGIYDFSAYVGKLLTYTINSDSEYVFRIAPLGSNTDASVLSDDDPEAYYTYESGDDGMVTTAFVKSSGNLYRFVKKNSSTSNTQVAPFKYAKFTDTTKVVIKTYDDDENPVFTVYDSKNMPNFDNSDEFANIKYIVKNNPQSTTTEDLVYLYAESTSGNTSIKVGNVLDYRFIKSVKSVKYGDDKVIYYDVYNPFKGTIEEEYETRTDSEEVICQIGGIYSLSNGYINDENLFGNIGVYGNIATSETTKTTEGLGLVAIDTFDEEHGLLEIDGVDTLFTVDENTVFTFLDFDNETIESVKSTILTSTSATYRCNDNKDMPLLAFIASSEIKNEEGMEHAEVICIVRFNELDVQ